MRTRPLFVESLSFWSRVLFCFGDFGGKHPFFVSSWFCAACGAAFFSLWDFSAAMSASPGPKPFWPDGRTWAVRTHRNVPMPLQRQWTVKAVVCSCICAWFTRIHQCSQHLLFQPWLIPLGSESCTFRKNQWFQWNSTRAQRRSRLQPRRWHVHRQFHCRVGTSRKQTILSCFPLFWVVDWIWLDYWRLLCYDFSIIFYERSQMFSIICRCFDGALKALDSAQMAAAPVPPKVSYSILP